MSGDSEFQRRIRMVALLAILLGSCSQRLPPHSIHGRVLTATGEVLPGVHVLAHGQQSDAETETAVDGSYLLSGLFPGEYTLTFSGDFLEPAEQSTTVRVDDSVEVDVVRFSALGQIHGQVTVEGGAPLPVESAVVVVDDRAETVHPSPTGEFDLLAPVGEQKVRATLGVAQSSADAVVPFRGIAPVSLTIVPNTSPVQAPVFRYFDRADHSGISVRIQAQSSAQSRSAFDATVTTEPDGSIKIPGCPRGKTTLSASADGYEPKAISGVVCPEWLAGGEPGPATLFRGHRLLGAPPYRFTVSPRHATVLADTFGFVLPDETPFHSAYDPGVLGREATSTRFTMFDRFGTTFVDVSARAAVGIAETYDNARISPDVKRALSTNGADLSLTDVDQRFHDASRSRTTLQSSGTTARPQGFDCYRVLGTDAAGPWGFDVAEDGSIAWITTSSSGTTVSVAASDGTKTTTPLQDAFFVRFSGATLVVAAYSNDAGTNVPGLFVASGATGWVPQPLTSLTKCSTLAFSTVAARLLAQTGQGSWSVFDLSSGNAALDFGRGAVGAVMGSRGVVFVDENNVVAVRDLLSGTSSILDADAHPYRDQVVFSPGERYVAYFAWDGAATRLHVRDMKSNKDVDAVAAASTSQLTFTADESHLLVGIATGTVSSVDLTSMTSRTLGNGRLLLASPKGSFALIASPTKVTIADVATGDQKTLPWSLATGSDAAVFSRDESRLLARLSSNDLVVADARTGTSTVLDTHVVHDALLETPSPMVVYDVNDSDGQHVGLWLRSLP